MNCGEICEFAVTASPTRPPRCGQSLSGVYTDLLAYPACSTTSLKGIPYLTSSDSSVPSPIRDR